MNTIVWQNTQENGSTYRVVIVENSKVVIEMLYGADSMGVERWEKSNDRRPDILDAVILELFKALKND